MRSPQCLQQNPGAIVAAVVDDGETLPDGINRINYLHHSQGAAMNKKAKSPSVGKKKPIATPRKATVRKGSAIKKRAEKTRKTVLEKPSAAPAETPKARVKLVRDSFTMPREDFERIARLKARAIEFKRPAKKSELLRAGLQALERMDGTELHAALDALTPIKTGRPKKRH